MSSLPIKLLYAARPFYWIRRHDVVIFELTDLNHVMFVRPGAGFDNFTREEWVTFCHHHPECKDFETHQITFSGTRVACSEIIIRDGEEIKIKRGHGIGIIADFSRDLYIRLWRDGIGKLDYHLTLFGQSEVSREKVGTWEDLSYKILTSSLSFGYDVYIIDHNGRSDYWCEHRPRKNYQTGPPALCADFVSKD
jgi:hypothetical protein